MGTRLRFKGRTAHELSTQIKATLRGALLEETPASRRPGEIPMPAPWAAGVVLVALLGFGVFVGSVLNGPPQAPTKVLLADSSGGAHRATAPKTPASPPVSTGKETSSEPSSEEKSEAETTTTTAATAPASRSSKGASKEASSKSEAGEQAKAALPTVQHVFLVVLSDEGESEAFGASAGNTYLAKTLRPEGELIEGYYAVSRGELANGIALISGQGPTPQTEEDCPLFADLTPGGAGKLGQTLGSGCVYPTSTETLASQLTNVGKTWKAYVEGLDEGSASGPQACQHPAPGAADPDQAPQGGSGYVTWRDPFVYFHSLIDTKACPEDVVGVKQLASDLRSARDTPSLAYIAPGRCHDGSPQPCAPGQPAGIGAADSFLRNTVGEIERSAAYKEGGLIAITFDQAPQSGAQADSSGCCTTQAFPNLPSTGTPSGSPASGSSGSESSTADATQPGGGKVGLLLISKYVKPNSFNATGEYNHFSLLRSIENLFGLQPLGYGAEPGLLAFDSSVFDAWHG
jgi:phosphatidylinositol-3-phosphatase